MGFPFFPQTRKFILKGRQQRKKRESDSDSKVIDYKHWENVDKKINVDESYFTFLLIGNLGRYENEKISNFFLSSIIGHDIENHTPFSW